MGDAERHLALAAWEKLCHHLDGVAIGGSVSALAESGALAGLAASRQPLSIDLLAEAYGLRAGYLNLAIRLLELQGFVRRGGAVTAGRATACLTAEGRSWLAHAGAYCAAPAAAPPCPDGLDGIARRVALHLAGPRVTEVMAALSLSGVFDALLAREGPVPLAALPGEQAALARDFALLSGQGWAILDGGRAALTDEGRLAAGMAPQYFYPASYLATFAAVPRLLAAGGAAEGLARDAGGTECHVDRALDIRFSGLVFARTCRAPFLEVALGLFDSEPVAAQPTAVVDCGSGDGTLLETLYEAIAKDTRRGAELGRHPLTMVGVEYNPVAQATTAETLAAAAVPHRALAGDIGEPEALVHSLRAAGIDPATALHVSKSVIHNRRFRGAAAPIGDPMSEAAFVAPDGGLIAAGAMEADLGDFFARWRAVLGRHGMIAIEAHTVPAGAVSARIGTSPMTVVEASHGYSHQYLVEIDTHRRAASRAGLVPVAARDLGAAMLGRPIMSLDHYLPA